MTFDEMVQEAQILYESIDSSDSPGFNSTEWSTLLTLAQRMFINDILQEGLTRNAFNRRALDAIITTTADLSNFTVGDFSDSWTVDDYPEAVWWRLNEFVDTATDSNIWLRPVSYDYYKENIRNPFEKPNADEHYWVMPYGETVVIITDGTTPTAYRCQYVEEPTDIASGQDCILHVSTHRPITVRAARLARVAVTDSAGFQTLLAEVGMSFPK